MASPCEVLLQTSNKDLASKLAELAFSEALRIEKKYSRYRDDNIMWQINNSAGNPVSIDTETYQLLVFAQQCYELSSGLFDITSGVLRKAWRFDGTDNIPSDEAVQALLPCLGWEQVKFNTQMISVPANMELDFGGFGKEYAVDRCLLNLSEHANIPVLVNFGGDIACNGALFPDASWTVGIESLAAQEGSVAQQSDKVIVIKSGALATSGDSRRYLLRDGVRYGHVLNPKTGYPIVGAPRSITVAAQSCIHAGLVATLALLQGPEAEFFLREEGVQHWCLR
jgi:thiamine biosynthesis lipoprotein